MTNFKEMENLKIDRTKLITVTNYANKHGLTRQAIHYRLKQDQLKSIEIDGVLFIKLD